MNSVSCSARSFMIFILIVLFLFNLPLQQAFAGKCSDALLRCSVAAGLTFLGNPAVGSGFAAWCVSGYVWCLQYFPESDNAQRPV
ncbi:hypothetical protein BVY01_04185 [bacterium I07]|nr:hypothetical protein BVY01_04185 [bacterium I07]